MRIQFDTRVHFRSPSVLHMEDATPASIQRSIKATAAKKPLLKCKMKLKDSTAKGKRLTAVFSDGTQTHFGLAGGSTYVDHKDPKKRQAYHARHRVREDFNDYKSAGALSARILWGPHTSIRENLKAYKKRFGL